MHYLTNIILLLGAVVDFVKKLHTCNEHILKQEKDGQQAFNNRTRELEKERTKLIQIVEEIRSENEELGKKNSRLVKDMAIAKNNYSKLKRDLKDVKAEAEAEATTENKIVIKPEDATEAEQYMCGLMQGKNDSLKVIRTLSEDIDEAKNERKKLDKDLTIAKKLITKYENNIKSFKQKSLNLFGTLKYKTAVGYFSLKMAR